MRDYYDDEPTIWRTTGKVAFAGAVLVIGYFGYNQFVASGSVVTPTAAAASAPTTAPTTAPSSALAATGLDPVAVSTEPAPDATVPPTTIAATPATPAAPEPQAAPTAPTTTTTAQGPTAADATALPTTSTTTSVPVVGRGPGTAAAPTGSAGAPPATLPDGSAAPVVAIFDVDTITLAGAVPDQAAADRLTALAVANSKTPAAVINLLTIDSAVPDGVGIRVVELNSSRFPAGSADVLPAHGAELDRMAAVMNALPNVTVLVIGPADQVGSEQNNFALSEQRARAVVHYLVDQGIDASRLSSRAVGESDLLSVDDDATSLALNRRTEFVVYGALVGA
jgi:outer membrane protein OmpA-like peptidoglycan-associated protein